MIYFNESTSMKGTNQPTRMVLITHQFTGLTHFYFQLNRCLTGISLLNVCPLIIITIKMISNGILRESGTKSCCYLSCRNSQVASVGELRHAEVFAGTFIENHRISAAKSDARLQFGHRVRTDFDVGRHRIEQSGHGYAPAEHRH